MRSQIYPRLSMHWPVWATQAILALVIATGLLPGQPAALAVSGTRFLLDGEPFPYTGLSFFNAIYNPAFQQNRPAWMEKFRKYGINVLRVWCQWDNKRGFADGGPAATMYELDGSLRADPLNRLKRLLDDARAQGMVVELTLFSQESWHDGIRLSPDAMERAARALSVELKPWRNVTLQIWNEFNEHTLPVREVIKREDPSRLVTNSPGVSGILGDSKHNLAMDYLTPHTTRYQDPGAGKPWEVGPKEIAYLLARYRMPVVDDEPARTGTPKFGGPREGSYPFDHILQINGVWAAGGYVTYHHDMFQTGYGSPAVPPSGIPDPEFSPYHKVVFEFLALRQRYQ